MTTYISNTGHYNKVLALVTNVRHTLWIGTADIKDQKSLQSSAKFLFNLWLEMKSELIEGYYELKGIEIT